MKIYESCSCPRIFSSVIQIFSIHDFCLSIERAIIRRFSNATALDAQDSMARLSTLEIKMGRQRILSAVQESSKIEGRT
jgi:hypothetical protein